MGQRRVARLRRERDEVSYLWEANIKSRNSFLMILEFMEIPRKEVKEVLQMLQPGSYSNEFYVKYVMNSRQFMVQAALNQQPKTSG